MSLASLLNVARGALLAHEKALTITGHNVANAETPGYRRQRVELAASAPQSLGSLGHIGTGVDVVQIGRIKSNFYDTGFRRESGVQSHYETLHRQLEQISGILGEPSDATLGTALDDLIDSLNDLASNPIDPTARIVVHANATALVDRFRTINQRLDEVGAQIGSELTGAVSTVNSYLDQIRQLNAQIQSTGGSSSDHLDRRDLLIDQLSKLVDIRVIDRGFGTVDVTLGGLQLVSSGGAVQHLSVQGGGPYQIGFGNPPSPVNPAQGEIAGLLDAFTALGTRGTGTDRATGLRGQLDDLALGIVSAVNEIHSPYDPTTKPLQPTLTPAPAPLRAVIPFFDPNGVTAGSIDLNAAIKADPSQIAAGYSTGPGDNTIVLRLGQLRNFAVPVPGPTVATPGSPAVTGGAPMILGEYYTGLIASLGVATRDAATRSESQSVLVDHIETQRQEQVGVNIDEEMVRLIQHQQAFAAAARLIQSADEMMQELLNLGR